ncbi:MAG: N-acetylmuramoyl-L-alanine amidase [Phycisphaeraceae bacterium]|nr:N-acetylmuramoyl-L-alanine amidase [Phycisphaeraceae bacterium]
MPDRRTITVLGALVVGMTLTSILLLLLTPGPKVPVSGVRLQAIEQETDRAGKLFDTTQPWHWQAIVIHDSGSAVGSSDTIHQAHEQLGRGGLGYHFVINNGSLAEDGQIDVGFRWQRQFAGFYVEGQGADWYNRNAIGICVIGDAEHQAFTEDQTRQLVWLVKQLQRHYGIPREAVHVSLGSDPAQPAAYFPYTLFSQQIDP